MGVAIVVGGIGVTVNDNCPIPTPYTRSSAHIFYTLRRSVLSYKLIS